MSKKRNLAVLMAAATVATSVAPVFAADATDSLDGKTISAKDSEKLAQLKKEVEGLFNVKYTDKVELLENDGLAGTAYYDVTVSIDGGEYKALESMKELNKFIATMEDDSSTIDLKVTPKATDVGYKLEDGVYVDNQIKTYTASEYKTLRNELIVLGTEGNDPLPTGVKSIDATDDAITITFENNDQPYTIKVGDKKVDLDQTTYKKDANGNFLDKDGGIVANDSEDRVANGFEFAREAIDAADIQKDPFTYAINNLGQIESTNAKTLYNITLGKLTTEGNSVLNFIKEYNDAKSPTGGIVKITPELKNGVLTLKVPVNKDGVSNKFTELTISGTDKELKDLNDIFSLTADSLKIETIAGDNRIETALQISKATPADNKKNVVLVSSHSIADGLAATPFAKANDATILLTDKEEIAANVMKEIKDITKDGGEVFLVGGTASLSTNIEKQLNDLYIANDRISGSDRMATSLEIAKSLVNGEKAGTKAFIAGGYAEADAMSVAAVAAGGIGETGDLVNPIILTGKDGLTAAQKSWFGRDNGFTKAYIAGGVNSVPVTVSADLKYDIDSVLRVAGDNRQSTNAQVIKEFYTDVNFNQLYVAKSDNNGLVDALPGGVLAGINKAPIVLATNTLDADQVSVLTTIKTKVDPAAKVQIGNGIADAVWTAINKIK